MVRRTENPQAELNTVEAPRVFFAPRIGLEDKVSGQARFIEGLPQTTSGAPVLSPYSHTKIHRLDAFDALSWENI